MHNFQFLYLQTIFFSSNKNEICIKLYLFPNFIEFIQHLAWEYSGAYFTWEYYWYIEKMMTIVYCPSPKRKKQEN